MRRLLVALVVCSLLVGGGGAIAIAQDDAVSEPTFSDVSADHEAFEAIEWAASVAVTVGYPDGTFRPGESLSEPHALAFLTRYYDNVLAAQGSEEFTRGDIVVALHAVDGGDTVDVSQPSFSDVSADHEAFAAVEWAASVGVTVGYSDGTFRPDESLSKTHALLFVGRYYHATAGPQGSDDFTRADMIVLLHAINMALTSTTMMPATTTTTPRVVIVVPPYTPPEEPEDPGPPPLPVVTISGPARMLEGDSASFVVAAGGPVSSGITVYISLALTGEPSVVHGCVISGSLPDCVFSWEVEDTVEVSNRELTATLQAPQNGSFTIGSPGSHVVTVLDSTHSS